MSNNESAKRVFVGGIPVRVEREAIVAFFSQFGDIRHCKLKKNSKTGRSVGYAQLTFARESDADRVLGMRHVEFAGRVCECKPVLSKESLKEQVEKEKKERLLVWNLDSACSNNDITIAFQKYAPISHAYVVREADGLISKGYGFVVFNCEEDLKRFCDKSPRIEICSQKVLYSAEIHLPPKAKKDVKSLTFALPADVNTLQKLAINSKDMDYNFLEQQINSQKRNLSIKPHILNEVNRDKSDNERADRTGTSEGSLSPNNKSPKAAGEQKSFYKLFGSCHKHHVENTLKTHSVGCKEAAIIEESGKRLALQHSIRVAARPSESYRFNGAAAVAHWQAHKL